MIISNPSRHPVAFSASYPSGGIQVGTIIQLIEEILEEKIGLPTRDIFSGGIVALSVGTILSTMSLISDHQDPSKPLYNAKERGDLFRYGSAQLISPSMRYPELWRLCGEFTGLAQAGLTEATTLGAKGAYSIADVFNATHKLPTPLVVRKYMQHEHRGIHMNTDRFDTALRTHFGYTKLSDLSGSIIFPVSRVTNNPYEQSAVFYRLERPDGTVDFSSTRRADGEIISHADLEVYNIIKASIAIPGVMEPHTISELGEEYEDIGHIASPAAHIHRLQKLMPEKVDHGHFMFGRALFPLLTGVRGLLAGIFSGYLKDMTCVQTYLDTKAAFSEALGDRFLELSFLFDKARFNDAGYTDKMPKKSILNNRPDQIKAIRDAVRFELEVLRAEEFNQIIAILKENAERILEMKASGEYYKQHRGDMAQDSVVPFQPRALGAGT